MPQSSEIRYWNRVRKQLETEKVYGEAWLRAVYENPVLAWITDQVLVKPPLSQFYGLIQSSKWSQRKVQPFIKNFSIPMEEFESGPFESFNDFFIRRFKPGARSFVSVQDRLAAPAEARYFGYAEVKDEQLYPVKGKFLNAEGMLGSKERAAPFIGGPLLIARLCPVDYHRFHFPDSGRVEAQYRVPGKLHSVNPVALRKRPDLFATNERQVAILETENFGKIAYIEVGAICVGKIVQSYQTDGGRFKRGDEKGYFLFGGSTVVLLGERGRWRPSQDVLDRTHEGIETLVQIGDEIGVGL